MTNPIEAPPVLGALADNTGIAAVFVLITAALAVSLTEKEVHEGKTPNADELYDEALDCPGPSGTGRAHPVGP
ncbi:hypothetical protein [Streptomyces gibsoniae]|uniref:Uncharacterized protein n=1 Tax=Streptomyces gibsoniae TaxID=3075529 RepID=A0ABU2U8G1_9ACTN|nr:hypothetical protein [Streptomyces sp. DSM 41699]MDT0469522.1 hypothetical protein [Streptomyces sp. DSM 41699]